MQPDLHHLLLNRTPLIDVRAPVEFNKGSLPGATNIPLLTIKLGLQLITDKERDCRVEAWTEFAKRHPEGYLFCFRGGLRSRISCEWLAQAGIEYPRISGGYKAVRTCLIEQLDALSGTLPFLLLGGQTGSGKTHLLKKLPRYIDLEGIAQHRGSSFGRLLAPQPGNIDFENELALQMLAHQQTPEQPIFLEDESRLIGRVAIPNTLHTRMLTMPIVVLVETMQNRIRVAEQDYIIDLYELYTSTLGDQAGAMQFADHHRNALHRIRKRFGGANYARALQLFNTAFDNHRKTGTTGQYHPYVELLLNDYYDPMYEYQFQSKNRQVLFTGNKSDIAEWVLDQAVVMQ